MTTIGTHVESPVGIRPRSAPPTSGASKAFATAPTYDDSFLADLTWEIGPDLSPATGGPVVKGFPGLQQRRAERLGRSLMASSWRRGPRRRSCHAERQPHLDYLLGANDLTRQEARFPPRRRAAFLAPACVAQLLDLERVLEAARQVAEDSDAMSPSRRCSMPGQAPSGRARRRR